VKQPLALVGIADDLTGASDLALLLAEQGMSSTLALGLPAVDDRHSTSSLVVALKTRTCPAEEAVTRSLEVADWALGQGAKQLFFKYCSTFDSTPEGNIGPVTESLRRHVNQSLAVVCPAFPANGRTVRNGQLLVNGVLLEESPMRDHPLTPMTKSDLPTLMNEQTEPGATGLVPLEVVRKGASAVRLLLDQLSREGRRFAVLDAETDEDLLVLGAACVGDTLVTGASGLALGLPAQMGVDHGPATAALPRLAGHPVILAGSCSRATRQQVQHAKQHMRTLLADPLILAQQPDALETLLQQAEAAWEQGPLIVHSAADPGAVQRAQEALGQEQAAHMVEDTLARIARRLARRGASKFLVAGGESSGAVARALQAQQFQTGPRIAPGVPWMVRADGHPQVFAFKSGNFGSETFFEDALALLP
jgi:uncharacterized protein YgbK (DUF1537 family)